MIYTILLFNIKNKIQCKIRINGNPYLNLKWLVLCLKNIIAKYEPKDPPINDTDSRVFSGIRHFLLIAFSLSINIKENEMIFINNIYNKRIFINKITSINLFNFRLSKINNQFKKRTY